MLRNPEGDEISVEYYPVLMAKLFQAHQQKGPGEIPPKRDFLFKECLRYAKREKIPFEVPHHLPFNPMLPLRLAMKECAGENQEKMIELLWEAIWVKGVDPEDPDEIGKILDLGGLRGDEYLDQAFSPEAKKGLKKNIELAISKKLFGVPSFAVDNELFWGNDSLGSLQNYLEGNDKFDLNKWKEFQEKLQH